MKLGSLSEPVIIFGGPYSNLPATQAMRKAVEGLGIPPSHVICTGDLVAYCAEPEAVVKEIRDWGIAVVMGNCEEALSANAPDCGCGFDSGSACALLSDTWYRFTDQSLSNENRSWMKTLSREIRLQLAGHSILVIHGAPSSINRFIFPSTPITEKKIEMQDRDATVIIGGHSGIPFGQMTGKGFWLNSGVIGMPANDATQSGWFMLLIPSQDGLTVEWHRLEYDWQKAQIKMRQAGLNNDYAQALETGLWPSMDVLPREERAQQGTRIELTPLNIPARVTR
jgi:predicted phosphodiesterase